MEDWQDRVVAERDDLKGKIERLAKFLDSGTYDGLPWAEQDRLHVQLRHMNNYREVLDQRIAAF